MQALVAFILLFPSLAFSQNSTGSGAQNNTACASYLNESRHVWDRRCNQNPACIFLPSTADEVASAISIFNTCGAQFAMRSGGHMNYPGSNNIDDGVLLSFHHMTELELSNDKKSIAVGPGNRWIDVYSELSPHGLYAIGGRLKGIGVAGLALVGGVNYYTNKYGHSMDNVVSYDVVLGNGTRAVANETSNPDLFWALKGGANNFAVVTRFVLKTFEIPHASTTIQLFGEEGIPDWIQAICDFVEHTGDDPSVAAGAVFNVNYNVTTRSASAQILGSQEGTESPPSSFANFSSVPGNQLRLDNVTTPAAFTAQFDAPLQLSRVQFGHHTIKPNATRIIEMYRAWREAVEEIEDIEGVFPTFVLNTAPKSAASVAKNNGIGNVWGAEDDQNYIWWQLANNWELEQDDLRVTDWSKSLLERFHRENRALGLASEFIYAGDASELQDAYAGVPFENLLRMQDVRERYDPSDTLRRLNWGGFKLGY